MFTLLFVLLQAAAPDGGISVRRESDPAAICLVMAAVESRKTARPVTSFDPPPIVKRDDTAATVTYRRALAGGKIAKVSCKMNLQTREVLSLEVAGQEILTAPQSF